MAGGCGAIVQIEQGNARSIAQSDVDEFGVDPVPWNCEASVAQQNFDGSKRPSGLRDRNGAMILGMTDRTTQRDKCENHCGRYRLHFAIVPAGGDAFERFSRRFVHRPARLALRDGFLFPAWA